MPTEGDQMGVVMTGPLTTRSPALGNPGSEIERVFREVGARNPTDVSAVMARDSSVNPETLSQLGRPTTYGDLSRRSADAAASSRRTEAPRLSTGAGSPFHSGSASLQSGSTSRLARPNAYRPTMYGGSSGTLSGTTGTGSSGGSRPLVAPRTSSGRVGGSRPVIVPGSNSSLYSRPTTSPSGSSSLRGSTSRSPSSIGSSPGRYSAPRTRSVGGSQSSGSSSRSSAGSSRSSAGSSRPSAGSSRPSGGSSRSSAGSSRPSGGSSKPNSSGAQKRQ
jgi:hypothetical protein